MNAVPVYLVRRDIRADITPEQFYSTLPTPGAILLGHVVGAHPFEITTAGAYYHHPDQEAGGWMSSQELVTLALRGDNDLSWRPHVGPENLPTREER